MNSQDFLGRIKTTALNFCAENYASFDDRDVLMVENAMLIGVSIALESQHGDVS